MSLILSKIRLAGKIIVSKIASILNLLTEAGTTIQDETGEDITL